MSERTLHIMSPERFDNVAAIVGDRTALRALHHALTMALCSGSGGAYVFSSDGEGFSIAVALEPDMECVHTSYAFEPDPLRSLRELVPLRAVKNFRPALGKALQDRQTLAEPFASSRDDCANQHGLPTDRMPVRRAVDI